MANNPIDDNGFSKLTIQELRKIVCDNVKVIAQLKEQKKDYVSSTNEVIKEHEKKIEAAMEAMKNAEERERDAMAELAGNTYLAGEAAKLNVPNQN